MKVKKGKKSPIPPEPEVSKVDDVEEEKTFGIDGQKMTLSDSTILNTIQITSLIPEDGDVFIPDDASSIMEYQEAEEVMKLVSLTEDVVAEGLSNLGISACGTKHIFLNLSLPGYGIVDVAILGNYPYLQKINLSYNSISDLSALSGVKHLVQLDVSHNELKSLMDFDPPFGLQEANFSHNEIEEIPDLTSYDHLVKLELDHNNIVLIRGLENCRSLAHLTMSDNAIEQISGLDHLKLHKLCLSNNQLTQIENLETLSKLQDLNLSGNNIFSLSGISDGNKLYSLNMEGNQISDLSELQHIDSIGSLRVLNFIGNPIVQVEDYRKSVIFSMQKLTELDGHEITIKEKVAAVDLFDPPHEVQAALDHITHTVYRFLQPSKVLESTLPSIEMPYPMLVLTGPQACGKRELAHRLAQEFPDYFGFGVSHTTRVPYPGEVDGKDYYFVTPDHFQILVRQGCFIQTSKYNGCLYGLTLDAVEAVAREGLACVVHMEINGVLTLKNTYFEPRFVLLLPVSSNEHRTRMEERLVFTESQIKHVIEKKKAMYQEINQEHPGFFDMVINSDKLGEAYDRLRQLVMDYLGTSDLTNAEGDATQVRLSTHENKDETSTHHTTTSANRRTWSRPSFQGETTAINNPTSAQKMKMEARKTPVEEASFIRRQNAAKEAVEGFSPGVYDDLFRRPMVPMTAPGMLEGSPMAQAASLYQDPSFTAALYAQIPGGKIHVVQQLSGSNATKSHSSSPDSSVRSRVVSSGLSGFSSARGFSGQEYAKNKNPGKDVTAPFAIDDEPLNLAALSEALESLKGSLSNSSRATPLAPRLVQECDEWIKLDKQNHDKRGSNVKPTLPPIPSGGR